MNKTFILFSLLYSFISYGQENNNFSLKDKTTEKRMSSFFVEAGGPALIFSLNYDVRLLKSHVGPGIRIGGGGMAAGGWTFYAFPVGLNYLLGKKSHTMELGAGATITNLTKNFSSNQAGLMGHMVLGYRLQPKDGGFSFRIGLNPFFGSESGNFYFIPFFGTSFGWVF